MNIISFQVQDLLKVLKNPYMDDKATDTTVQPETGESKDCRDAALKYTTHAPSWASDLRVS